MTLFPSHLNKLNQLNSKFQGLIQVTFMSLSVGNHNPDHPIPPGRPSDQRVRPHVPPLGVFSFKLMFNY